MFMGTTHNSIDEKNRMIVPSKLRAGLGSRCVLTKGLDRCLYIYTMEDWEKQMFIRHFCANAAECEFDKQGRIGIPQELKAYAGIEKELVTMGAMSKIEIWARDVWEAPDNENRMESEDFAKALAAYNF